VLEKVKRQAFFIFPCNSYTNLNKKWSETSQSPVPAMLRMVALFAHTTSSDAQLTSLFPLYKILNG